MTLRITAAPAHGSDTGAPAPGRVAGRAAWAGIDQALSSLSNFALSLTAVRMLGLRDLGSFGVAYGTYQFLVLLSRALIAEPLVMRFSHVDTDTWRRAAGSALRAAFVFGLLCAAILMGVSQALGGALAGPLFALGIVMPGLLVQDACRFIFFAGARPELSAANDFVWMLVVVPGMAVAIVSQNIDATSFILVWGLAGCVAAVVGLWQAPGIRGLSRGPFVWFREQRDLSLRLALEFVIDGGATQIALLSIAGLAGLAALGSVRAVLAVLGPVYFIFMGVQIFAVPELVRLRHRAPQRVPKLLFALCAFLCMSAVATCVALLVVPAGWMEAILGENWESARPLLPVFSIFVVAAAAIVSARIGLRVFSAVRQSLIARSTTAPLVIGATALGAWQWQAGGAAWGLALGNLIAVALWWSQLIRLLRSNETRPATDG